MSCGCPSLKPPAGSYAQCSRAGKAPRAPLPRALARLYFVSLSALCHCVVYFLSFLSLSLSVSVRVCLRPSGPPLRCSSASSTPPEQSPSPPPSPPANDGAGRLLGNGAAQPPADSDSEEEFVPNSFLVQSGSGNLCVAANGECDFFLPSFICTSDSRARGFCRSVGVWCWVLLGKRRIEGCKGVNVFKNHSMPREKGSVGKGRCCCGAEVRMSSLWYLSRAQELQSCSATF